ncbi:hypothetical protein HDU96_007462 [Phlyctochytrium bullatum]|nr:hypothetical protein HDU96_007462 [Phlyctochytrium bullatum]
MAPMKATKKDTAGKRACTRASAVKVEEASVIHELQKTPAPRKPAAVEKLPLQSEKKEIECTTKKRKKDQQGKSQMRSALTDKAAGAEQGPSLDAAAAQKKNVKRLSRIKTKPRQQRRPPRAKFGFDKRAADEDLRQIRMGLGLDLGERTTPTLYKSEAPQVSVKLEAPNNFKPPTLPPMFHDLPEDKRFRMVQIFNALGDPNRRDPDREELWCSPFTLLRPVEMMEDVQVSPTDALTTEFRVGVAFPTRSDFEAKTSIPAFGIAALAGTSCKRERNEETEEDESTRSSFSRLTRAAKKLRGL